MSRHGATCLVYATDPGPGACSCGAARPIAYATCPLPHCDKDLGIEVTAWDVIDDRPGPRLPGASIARSGYWKLVCEEGHVVEEGGYESDGRTPIIGHRLGQSLGGLR